MSDKKDLIVARLCGGLGNQLFIYAAARRIAEARGAELLLDAYSDFAKDRKYGAISQLQHFAIKADFAPKELCFSPHAGRHLRDLQVSLSKHLPLRHRFIVREADFDALCGGAPLRRLVRLEGYWQSERYFAPIADKLVDELQVVSPLSAKSREVLDRIAATQSVCVHIRQRRGAHLAFGRQPPPQAPQLPFAYYEEAVERVCRHVERPTFFCFGDNPDWMRERWKFPYPVHFVDHNRSQETAYEDLALMSQCRHFVVGNSTFSWWGAWLSGSAGKFVVAPASEGRLTWGAEPDLIPANWIVLKADQS
ncbi:MAG: alpha-1,2-fucosyltransferase [Rhizomicrobium sp.]